MSYRSAIIAFSFTLLATSSLASDIERNPSFGEVSCPPTFPCILVDSHDADRSAVSQIIENANRCVARSLSLRNPDGYFVESYGIGSDKCLKTKSIPSDPAGLTMKPHCCVKQSPKGQDQCQLVCVKYGTK